MAVQYHIYRGDGSGGPIDYSTPVATTPGLAWDTPPLAPGSRNRFGVRAFDPDSGQEEKNVDAAVEIVIDGSGADVTGRPNPPSDLQALATAGGVIRVAWTYNPGGQGGPPTSFKLWATAGTSVDYSATPSAVIPYSARSNLYSADLAGLTDGTTYTVGVRAASTIGDETNTLGVSIVADGSGPEPVDDFAGMIG